MTNAATSNEQRATGDVASTPDSRHPRVVDVAPRGSTRHFWAVVSATAMAQVKRWMAYTIDVIRMPLGALLLFATWRITYAASGRTSVGGANVSGFLLIGMIGLLTWTSTIWASGYAIEEERSEGTAAALFLSPASRNAVITGYGIGSFVWLLPSFLVVAALGFATGARLYITDPAAVVAGLLVLGVGSLACGFAFSGLFVLSRRGNLLANFLQTPIYLLAGVIVPRSSLPDFLQPLSVALPLTHAVDALRASSLSGAGLDRTWSQLLLALVTAAAFVLVGAALLRRVEHAAKRSGALDLY